MTHPENIATCVCEGDLVEEIFSVPTTLKSYSLPKKPTLPQGHEVVLGTLPGDSRTMKCDDEEKRQSYPVEFLNSLTSSGMLPHRLNLEVNAVVMLLCNLYLQQGLCNGTHLKVMYMHFNCIQATILTGANKGDTVLIPSTQ